MNGIGPILSRRLVVLLVTTSLGLLGMSGVASAASYTVNDTSDAGLANTEGTTCVSTDSGPNNCTLRAAVEAADNSAAGGDATSTITVPAGTYTFSTSGPGELDINSGASVTITGSGSGSTIINANGVDRAFSVETSSALSLSGMTIENGSPTSGSANGGGVWTDGALTITGDVTFKADSALGSVDGEGGAIFAALEGSLSVNGAAFTQDLANPDGGAIYDDTAVTATITDSAFNSNVVGQEQPSESDDDGGAIYGGGAGGLTIDSSSFNGNSAEYGGAIYWDSPGSVTATSSSFTGNAASWEYGGAIYDAASSGMTLDSDRFIANTAGFAGALYLDSEEDQPTYTLNQDEFDSNVATYSGGAVLWEQGNLTSTGSSFTHNSAGGGGALLDESDGNDLTLVNDTISDNTADYGGGIEFFEAGAPTTMTNDTIAFNTAGSGEGGGILGTEAVTTDANTTGILNTIVGDNTGGDCSNGIDEATQFASSVDEGFNMDSDSSCFTNSEGGGPLATGDKPGVDPMLAHAADNGGPVLTDAELPGSPAIDAGTNLDSTTNVSCPSTDARGIARSRTAADPCDIGAYEAVAAGLSLGKNAPMSAATNSPFTYSLTVSNGGPGVSTGTVVTDQLPAGETLLNVSSSQGSCTSSGSPADVSCDLGNIASGQNVTVAITVAEANQGTVTNTATAKNGEGSSASASTTTLVSAPPAQTIIKGLAGPAPGRLQLDSTRLSVSDGMVSVQLTCESKFACNGNFTIEKRAKIGRSHVLGPVVCTKSTTTSYRIAADKTVTVKAGVSKACLALLNDSANHTVGGKLTSGPRTGQDGIVKNVTLLGAARQKDRGHRR